MSTMDYSRINNNTGRTSAFMKYRLNKYTTSISGTTHKIRENLNFKDEMKWKRFSNRRLELIDKFKLSKFKASEQDQNIKQIANMLRTEFGYPDSTLSEFEKLVTAAVQSVRRNRRRSMKRRAAAAAAAMSTSSITGPQMIPPFMTANGAPANIRNPMGFVGNEHLVGGYGSYPKASMPNTYVQTPMGFGTPMPQYVTDPIYQTSGLQPNVYLYSNVPRNTSGSNLNQNVQLMPQNNEQMLYQWMNNTNQQYNTMNLPVAVNMPAATQQQKVVDLSITNNASSEQEYDTIIKSLISNIISSTNTRKSDNSIIPVTLRDSLINAIKRSQTCYEISQSVSPLKAYEDLRISGEMAIRDSTSFVIQNHFHQLISSSLEFATAKTCSPQAISSLSVELFSSNVKLNILQLPMVEVQIELLELVLGGVIKDFGYDPHFLPLADIIHEKLKGTYSEDPSKMVGNKLRDETFSTDPHNVLPDNVHFKKINATYKGQEQFFIFRSSDKKSITILDILENCRSKFNIPEDEVNYLAIYYNKELIVNDIKLSQVFTELSDEDELSIEIKGLNSDESKVQSPLLNKSNVVNSILNIPEKSNSNDLSITLPPMVVNKINQSSFGNGTLPRPLIPVAK